MAAPALTRFTNGQGVVNADYLNGLEQTCDTYAQLRAISGTVGMQVSARGASTINDGGQGSFYWSATSTAADDNAFVIVPTGTSVGAWLRVTVSTSFNILTFPVLSQAPPNPVIGQVYLDTTLGPRMFYLDSTWHDFIMG
jgi:hypothetical protein